MINILFILVEIFLIILLIGYNLFFTKKEIILFFFLIFVYTIATWTTSGLTRSEVRRMDLVFLLLIYLLEIFFIYRRKSSLFLAAVFTITQNTILVILWTIIYDIPFLDIERRSVYIDNILIQLVLLCIILFTIFLLNKKFKFVESFLAINKKYNYYSLIMMTIHSAILLMRQVMLFTSKLVDYFYLTIILTFFSIICLLIIIFINYKYKKQIEIQTFVSELGLLENKNDTYQEFKHDYNNILMGLQGYLKEDNLVSARQYLDSIISYSSDMLLPNYYFVIKEIPFPAVQSILLNTLKNGEEKNLDIILNVQNFPKQLNIDLVDFIRCFSILLNNAIEHSTKKVLIDLFVKEENFQIVVKNTYVDIKDISTLFKKGYSTKSNPSGIGLHIFQKILNSYTNTSYSVNKDEEWITFSFNIKK